MTLQYALEPHESLGSTFLVAIVVLFLAVAYNVLVLPRCALFVHVLAS